MAASNQFTYKTFWVVDALEENCVRSLRESLLKAANALTLCVDPLANFHVGLCAILRTPESKEVQLQVHHKLSEWCLRGFHMAVRKLKPSQSHSQSDQQKLAIALKSTVHILSGHSASDSEFCRERCIIYVVAQTVRTGPHLKKVLRMAAGSHVEIRFLIFPLDLCEETGVDESSFESDFSEFASDIDNLENSTLTLFPCDPLGFEQAALSWCRDMRMVKQRDVQLVIPDMEGATHRRTIECVIIPEHMHLDTTLAAGVVCPCHGEVLEILDSRGNAVREGIMGISDSSCPVTGAPLCRRDCVEDPTTVKLGSATLRLPSFSVAHKDLIIDTKTLPLSIVTVLMVRGRVAASTITDSFLIGEPHILTPNLIGPLSDDYETNDRVMAALCTALNTSGEALLAECRRDMDSGSPLSFPSHYLLRPSQDNTCLLARRVVTRESLLPMGAAKNHQPNIDPNLVERLRASMQNIPPLDPFDPFAVSAGCHARISKLVEESLPPTKGQPNAQFGACNVAAGGGNAFADSSDDPDFGTENGIGGALTGGRRSGGGRRGGRGRGRGRGRRRGRRPG